MRSRLPGLLLTYSEEHESKIFGAVFRTIFSQGISQRIEFKNPISKCPTSQLTDARFLRTYKLVCNVRKKRTASEEAGEHGNGIF